MKDNMGEYNLVFDGYWKLGKTGVADYPGIYCIYSLSPDAFVTSRLLYIGESKNVESRIADHMNNEDMMYSLIYDAHDENSEPISPSKDTLHFSASEITDNRDQVEAAMINAHKPPSNTDYVNNFPFENTKVVVQGKIHRLMPLFSVFKSP